MPDVLLAVPVAEPTLFMKVIATLGVAGAGYILGSLCFAIIFTWLFKKQDIRTLGSCNAGTANAFRSAGLVPGVLTGIFDFLKGVLAVYIGYWLFEWVGYDPYTGGCFAALFVLIGHMYPVFFKFHGGKGVMTVAGIMVVLNWRVFLISIAIYAIVLAVTRISSVASLSAVTVLPVVNAILLALEQRNWVPTTIYFAAISVLIWYNHRDNIKRLKEGKENLASVLNEKEEDERKAQ